MDLMSVFEFIFGMIRDFWVGFTDALVITVYGQQVSVASIMIAFLIISMVSTVFWKGAQA